METGKKFVLGLVAALAISLVFGACGPRPAPTAPTEPTHPTQRKAALRISVQDATTGQPIAGASVHIQAGDGTAIPPVDATADAQGYHGEQLPVLEGEFEVYDIQVIADGYQLAVASVALRGDDVDLIVPLHPIPPPCSPAWPGQLQLVDGAYVGADGQPVLIGTVHAGDLFGRYTLDPEPVRQQLRAFRQAGYSVVRVWINANDEGAADSYWSYRPAKAWGPRSTRNYEDVLTQFAMDVDAACLRLHTAAGDLIGTTREQANELFAALANAMQRAGPHVWALAEGINEGRDTGGRDPREIERLVQRVRGRHPGVLYALSAYTGHEDRAIFREWTPEWMRFVYSHPPRGGHWWDKIRHLYSFSSDGEGEPVRRNCWHGEPSGPGASAQENGHELDDEAMPLLAAQSLFARCNWTFMSHTGVVWNEGGTFEEQPGYSTTPQLIAMLPPDVMRWQLHHSGPRWVTTRVLAASESVRVDGAQSEDGRFAYVIYGPSGRHTLQVHRSFTGVLIHPSTGEETRVTKRAGDVLVVEFTRGRVLVGQVQ